VSDGDYDNNDYGEGIRGPEQCCFCGKPRDSYTGMLCDECREKGKQLKRSIDESRKAGGDEKS
jgi:hypothetical protein